MTLSATETKPKQNRNILLTVAALFGVVALLFGGVMLRSLLASPDLAAELEGRNALYFKTPRPVPAVDLTNHRGEAFNTAGFTEQWHLINFGYTFCPDICPTNMVDMATAYRTLEQEGLSDQIQMWMITVDPKRDTVEALSGYVPFYHPEFIGLTGEESALQPLAQQLNTVFYLEGEAGDGGESYTVAHSDNLAIINPKGEYVALLRPPHRPQQMSEVLSLLVQYGE